MASYLEDDTLGRYLALCSLAFFNKLQLLFVTGLHTNS